MVDVVDKATRSRMMAGISGRNTRPELALRKALHRQGFRFRLHVRTLAGRPDLVLTKYRAAVFVHGCFWHRHQDCRFTTNPATRPQFWAEKFRGNVERDARNAELLKNQGWRVATVWECELRAGSAVVERLAAWLREGGEVF